MITKQNSHDKTVSWDMASDYVISILGLSHNLITMLIKYVCSNYEKRIPAKHETLITPNQCWPIVFDAGPTPTQHQVDVPCLLGCVKKKEKEKCYMPGDISDSDKR